MDDHLIIERFNEAQRYIGWQKDDPKRLRYAGELVETSISKLIDDFYEEIQRHPDASKVITGGMQQVAHLKATLRSWLRDLFVIEPDSEYVMRRWKVGWRHVEIGLMQIYVNAAMARLRGGIIREIYSNWKLDLAEFYETCAAVNRALDLDLAIIQDAYEAEKRLRSEAVFRNLIESAPCAILILRDDFSIAYANPFTEKVSGFSGPQLIACNVFDRLFSTEDRTSIREYFMQAAVNGCDRELEFPVKCNDSTQRRLVWNARKLAEFDGSPAILAVGHDITELQEAQDRVLQAERLAAIGQTVTGLAHESRNAFQRMQACLEMLSLEVETQPEALELVDRIQRAQDHLHHLYEEVRNYAAPIRLSLQTCDMSHLVRDIWEQLEVTRQPKQIQLSVDSELKNPVCRIDQFAIGQVVRNILENAIAASPNEALIQVAISSQFASDNGSLLIAFRDQGNGITPQALSKVFAPFFTTKTKGTGLGMAIAKRIVDAHGGQLTAANPPEGGAEFLLTLPLAKP